MTGAERSTDPEPDDARSSARHASRRDRAMRKRNCWVRQAQETPSLREILAHPSGDGTQPTPEDRAG